MASRHDAMAGGSHGQGPGASMPGTKPGTDDLVADGHDHPGEGLYVRVAVILAIVTLVEVVIYYLEGLRDFLVPILIVLSVGKFVAVVAYFMHLKFDSRFFRWMFVAGLFISASVVLALLAMQWTGEYYPGFTPSPAENGGAE